MLDRLRRLPVLARILIVMAAAFVVMMAMAVGLASSIDAFWGYIWEEAKWRGAVIVIAVPLIYLLIYLFGRSTTGE
jgi:hypothetical protein